MSGIYQFTISGACNIVFLNSHYSAQMICKLQAIVTIEHLHQTAIIMTFFCVCIFGIEYLLGGFEKSKFLTCEMICNELTVLEAI